MCIRNFVAAVLGAALVFTMTTASWLFLPYHQIDRKVFKDNGETLTRFVKENALESGIYMLPNLPIDIHKYPEKQIKWQEKAKVGPYLFMALKSDGLGRDLHFSLGIEFITQLIAALGASYLLARSSVSNIFKKAFFVSFAVTLGVFLTEFGYWNWDGFPIRSIGLNLADTFVAWLVAGFFMSLIVKQKS